MLPGAAGGLQQRCVQERTSATPESGGLPGAGAAKGEVEKVKDLAEGAPLGHLQQGPTSG